MAFGLDNLLQEGERVHRRSPIQKAVENWFRANKHWLTHPFPRKCGHVNCIHLFHPEYPKFTNSMLFVWQTEKPGLLTTNDVAFRHALSYVTRRLHDQIVQPICGHSGSRREISKPASTTHHYQNPEDKKVSSYRKYKCSEHGKNQNIKLQQTKQRQLSEI
jgi:hypothetical protein